MPIKFNPEAAEFTPNFGDGTEFTIPLAPIAAATSLHLDTDVKQDTVFDSVEPGSPLSPASEIRDKHLPMRSPKRSPMRKPALPRINSGFTLENLEFDFEDAILDCPLSVDKQSPHMSVNGTEMLWEPKEEDVPRSGHASASGKEGVTRSPAVSGVVQRLPDAAQGGDMQETICPPERETNGDCCEGSPYPCGMSPSGARVDADSFEILCMIGQGGFGKVFQVKRKTSGRVFAMKCMRKDCVLRDNMRGTKAERSILSTLRHPYIVNMHWAFQCNARLYIVMDYFPGGQFLDMLQHHSPFDHYACVVYTAEIVLALEELHRLGIVHRDLKPENLLVDSEGHIVVTDFGCSKVEEEGAKVRTMSWAGTELYMAPEQLLKQEYGSEVDWWALGALTWEMATGDHPFYHNNRKTIVNNILKKRLVLPSWLPSATHSLLKGLLMRDPAKRLGHVGGAEEIKKHPFFKTVDMSLLLERKVPAPLRSHAKTGDEFDTSGHSERYTTAARELSPVPSPELLSRSKQQLFEGFSWSNSHHDGMRGGTRGFAPRLPTDIGPSRASSGSDAAASRRESDCEAPDPDEDEVVDVVRSMSVSVPIPTKTVSGARPMAIRC